MKSAYELAMERLAKSQPAKALTAAQKADIAEVESLYKSRIAEREIRFRDEIAAAEAAGEHEKAETGRKQLAIDKAKLEEEKEYKKEQIRNAK